MIPDFLRTFPVKQVDFDGAETETATPVEEPLELQLRYPGDPPSTLAVLMRTPGDDLDLVAGFLLSERIIESVEHLVELREAGIGRNTHNIVLATLVPDRLFEPRPADRFGITSAACGVCGTTAIDSATAHTKGLDPTLPQVTPAVVEKARAALAGLALGKATGSTHAAAVIDATTGDTLVREDVNDHFALDKALGGALRSGRPPASAIVATTSRASFEIVEKVVGLGAPVLISHGTPTSLAVRMAAEHGVTLVAISGGDARVFSGVARLAQTVSR